MLILLTHHHHQCMVTAASYLFMCVAPGGPMMENGSQMPDTILNWK